MKQYYILALLIVLTACSKKETTDAPFDAFVYSFTDSQNNFSIKFTSGDTVYMQKRQGLLKKNFYALATASDKDSIIALTGKVDFTAYEKSPEAPKAKDGVAIKFYTIKDGKERSVYAFSVSNSEKLFPLAVKFTEFAKRFNFEPIDKNVDFGDLQYIELPISPPSGTVN
ncbi:hypothetical protein [Flavobacterium sp.]|uniref:hypothetical protein n=1 Tax=Flavobacterium sp. TaxID=239 RepID=UPI004033C4A2